MNGIIKFLVALILLPFAMAALAVVVMAFQGGA